VKKINKIFEESKFLERLNFSLGKKFETTLT